MFALKVEGCEILSGSCSAPARMSNAFGAHRARFYTKRRAANIQTHARNFDDVSEILPPNRQRAATVQFQIQRLAQGMKSWAVIGKV
jgi:hypothetical protein